MTSKSKEQNELDLKWARLSTRPDIFEKDQDQDIYFSSKNKLA